MRTSKATAGKWNFTGVRDKGNRMISVIAPVWNRSDLTHQYLLQNNMHYSDDPTIQWIIIDNGSDDGTSGTLQYWKDIYGDQLIILKNSKNKGFSCACNQGAERAEGEILLFLNNDIVVQGDYISPLENAIGDNPRALVGAQIVNFDTGWNVFGGKVIAYIPGWCLALKREIFNELGGFDARFSPAYYEDVDLCHNALQRGFELQRVQVPLKHLGEQTGRLLGEDKLKITEANRIKFAEKWGLEL